ncbi:cytochrome P450 716A67-like [Vicia villosa]|uniref:cytochrome P450 716A67-like n=1 Tax=Vicia villosa TaxID=3911 RepID=UPI00273BB358|nr:cytochrome P450 716A67-like [Vicia villosa]
MEATYGISAFIVLLIALVWAWSILNWIWLKPKKLEKLLREQGVKGNPYRLLVGDIKDLLKIQKEATSKPMNLSDDVVPYVFPFGQQSVAKHGKNSFIWLGPIPRVILTDPELVKEVFNKIYDFQKPNSNQLVRILATGLIVHEGEKWSKHRKIINPAFHLEKLKLMLPAFFQSCNDLINKWEGILSSDGSCEVDAWPFVQKLASDAIARTAFGSSYEEGMRIFELQKEQAELTMKVLVTGYIPGWRFLPTTTNKRLKEIDRDVIASLTDMINKREREIKVGEATKNDLLGILLESNHKEIKENNNKDVGMNLDDVIKECKLFYLAGEETTSVLLVWTIILLSRHPNWQARARQEVIQVFGNKKPDFDELSRLKIMTMILYEVLRLYPPIIALPREVQKDVKVGNLTIPAGVQFFLPALLVHHDTKLWGDDANVFNPERFSEGVLKATNGKTSFFPFGGGPRLCIGQNFTMLEAKMAIAMILQHFSFELSPTYAHAPITVITLRPKHGAQIILRKLEI